MVDIGERVVRATVRGGGTADAMEWKLPALVHGSAQRQFFAGRLSDTFQAFEFELPEKRKPSLTQLELTLSPSLLAVMFDALPYLAEYPYGCVEQTLSRFVPATIARRAVKDLGMPSTRVPANLDDMVQKGLERLVRLPARRRRLGLVVERPHQLVDDRVRRLRARAGEGRRA